MHDLLPILQQKIDGDLIQTVNARDLHGELEVKKAFSTWLPTQVKRCKLIENTDYIIISPEGRNSGRGRPATEYHISIDAAKSIAMVSGTDKGAEVRQYFINCEKQLKAQQPTDLSRLEILQMALASEQEKQRLAHQVETLTPKADALDKISNAEGLETITDAAKTLQVKRKVASTVASVDKPKSAASIVIWNFILIHLELFCCKWVRLTFSCIPVGYDNEIITTPAIRR